jgi:hypothetical protein
MWQPIETAPYGIQILAWEPDYGWLLVVKKNDGFEQKSSGNFWVATPSCIKFTHWMPLPAPPDNGE